MSIEGATRRSPVNQRNMASKDKSNYGASSINASNQSSIKPFSSMLQDGQPPAKVNQLTINAIINHV